MKVDYFRGVKRCPTKCHYAVHLSRKSDTVRQIICVLIKYLAQKMLSPKSFKWIYTRLKILENTATLPLPISTTEFTPLIRPLIELPQKMYRFQNPTLEITATG